MLVQNIISIVIVVMKYLKEIVDWLLKRLVIRRAEVTQLRRVVDFGDSQSMNCHD